MKIDLYTKIVLTVIAVCLAKIALFDAIPQAVAQGSPTKVVVCDPSGYWCQGRNGWQ